MKKIYLLAMAAAACLSSYAQSPISLTNANTGTSLSTYKVRSLLGSVTTMTPGTNVTWDFGSLSYVDSGSITYDAVTDPFFQGKTIASFPDFNYLNSQAGYNITYYVNKDANSYSENGFYVPYQAYDISSYTMGAGDTIYMPEQSVIMSAPRTVLQFPATYPGNWSSVSRRAIDLKLTINAYSLNKVPAQHVINVYRTDSVLGWGKMRVPSNGGASKWYDVLMLQSWQYQTDSFYMNGTVAPVQLTTAFGITQGAKKNYKNRIYFFQTGSVVPLMLISYGSSNFTTPTRVDVDDNVEMPNGIATLNQDGVTGIYPNPVSGNELVVSGSFNNNLVQYSITDLSGRMVKQGQLQAGSNGIIVSTDGLESANYIITIYSNDAAPSSARFTVIK